MNSHPAMTVSPTGYDDSTGTWSGESVVTPTGFADSAEAYQPEDDSVAPEQDSFSSEYVEALFDADPRLDKAVAWGSETMTKEERELYNADIESGDPDRLHKSLDWLLSKYEREADGEPQTPEEEPELEPLDQEEISREVDALLETEPAGMETAYSYLEAAEKHQDDALYSAMMRSTADFHAGKTTAAEAIQKLSDRFGAEKVARYYKQLQA